MIDTSDIKVLHINLNKSQQATESVLQVAIELQIDLILVQEPWLIPRKHPQNDYSGTRSINHPSFTQILPHHDLNHRPRTLVYALNKFQPHLKLNHNSPKDADIQVLDMTIGNDNFTLINIYNQLDQASKTMKTAERCLYQTQIPRKTIVVGDFNVHHPLWESQASITTEGENLVEWMEENELELANLPGQGTFFRPQMTQATVIDLTLASNLMSDRIQDWQTLPDIGSDHSGLLFTIQGLQSATSLHPTMQQVRFNTKKANWAKFSTSLQNLANSNHLLLPHSLTSAFLPYEPREYLQTGRNLSTEHLDQLAQALTDCVMEAATDSIPQYQYTSRSKPWWSEDLTSLRNQMA